MRSDLPAVTIESLRGRAAAEAFVPLWERLLERDPEATIFQSPQLFMAWQRADGDGEQPWLLVAHCGGEAIGFAALVVRTSVVKGLRIRTVSFGAPRGDFVAAGRRDDVIAAACAWLEQETSQWDVLEMNDVRTATAEAVDRCLAGRSRCHRHWLRDAPAEAWLDVDRTWKDYLQERGAHFRHRLRPQTTKIERLGKVTLERHAGAEAVAAYERFLELEARSWKAQAGDTQLPARERVAFRELLDCQHERIEPDVLFLNVDDRPAAAMLSVRHRHVYYLFVTYFDDALRAWYPGRRLLMESLLHAFERPDITELSFIGAYPFAMAWANNTREYRSIRFYGSGLRARWARTFEKHDEPAAEPPARETADA